MAEYKLKLDERLVPLLKSGIKTLEYRKLNKDYIHVGDLIKFVDMNTLEPLDLEKFIVVKRATYRNPSEELNERLNSCDSFTYSFVNKHYQHEKEIIEFEIKKWSEYEKELTVESLGVE